ncbi:MAG: UDP-N-acetylmuramoyl-tripeptide--D-alanyl-D-alanine ligase [Candidatus Omnitrophota bacterium]
MLKLNIEKILEITEGKLIQGDRNTFFAGVSTDSRSIREGNIFIALKGANFDGHDFVRDVLAKGAKGAIVEKNIEIGENHSFCIIQVSNTLDALRKLASYHRCKFNLPIIAITGSNGKTTVKEMISHITSPFMSVLKTPFNYNNQIGLAFTLLELDNYHELAVFEIGISQPGEMEVLRDMVKPDVAVFTNIGMSHLEFLKSPFGVLKEKLRLVSNFNKNNTVVFNADDCLLRENLLKNKGNFSLLSFGIENPADFRGESLFCSEEGIRFKVKGVDFFLPLIGIHNIYNALAAIAVGSLYDISLEDMAFHLKNFLSPKMRMNILRIRDNNLPSQKEFILIDDTYNANPNSVASAIEALSYFRTEGRKVLVIADMLELGDYALECHRKIGLLLNNKNIDILLTKGRYAEEISKTVLTAGKIKIVQHFNSNKEIIEFLEDNLRDGDVLLVKGSRGMHMEEIIQGIKEKEKIITS